MPGTKCFLDKEYGFIFRHELTECLEDDYEGVYSKYMRRIEKFRERIREDTCFIRAVADQDEISYIAQNTEYIHGVIKKSNPNNEIIYLIPRNLYVPPELAVHFYRLEIDEYRSDLLSLRDLFDSSPEFISFLKDNFNEKKRADNLVFDSKWREEKLRVVYLRYRLLLKIENTDFHAVELPKHLAIYGAGNIGRIFYKKIKSRCAVTCFVNEKSDDGEYDGIPIITPNRLKTFGETGPVIVTPMYDYDKICRSLNKICGGALEIFSLEEVLDSGGNF